MSVQPDKPETDQGGDRRIFVRARVIVNQEGGRFGYCCQREGPHQAEFLADLWADLVERIKLQRPIDPAMEPIVAGEIHLQFELYTDARFTLKGELQ